MAEEWNELTKINRQLRDVESNIEKYLRELDFGV